MTDGQQKDIPESEKMLAQIEEAKSKEAVVASAQSPEVAPSESPEKQAAVADKGAQAVQDGVQEAPAKKADKPEDAKEWARKKGLKDEESIARSLRELERKMHQKAYEDKQKDALRGTIPPPAYVPQPQFAPQFSPPPPAYQPPYLDRSKIIEQEAKRFNMDPEDFEKVLNLTTEVNAVNMRRMKAEYDSQIQELKRETSRNSEIRELMQDPLFTNLEVQREMHRVLEENPTAQMHEPMPYRYAFDEAQRRLARKFLQEGVDNSEPDARTPFPTEPPKEGAKGSSPSFERTKEQTIMDSFAKAKTADEQRKILTSLGAIQNI